MASIRFEGREVPTGDGDTVAAALYRAGVRTFSRSVKYHRRRGLYCGTGDCPNCLMTVDGQPAVRTCITECRDGMSVERSAGWPNAEHDLLHVTDSLHRLMPVGFYYKTFIRPRFAWTVAERVIRRATGLGSTAPDHGRRAEGRAAPARRRAGRRRRHRRAGGGARRRLGRARVRCSSATKAASAPASRPGVRSTRSVRSKRRCGSTGR